VHPKNLLIVAFQFPPMSGSSGLLRALKFCRYLPEFGWTPTVLTAHPRLYEQVDDRQLSLIPEGLRVIRAFGLDAKRHLSIRGRYSRLTALPDAWASWSLGAIPSALRFMRRTKTDAVFTTFPIATSVWIGLVLHRLTGKPWIVDFRDSMTEEHYPSDPTTWRVWRWLERQAIRRASLLLFTAESAIRMYRQRYPELSEKKCVLLPNGYDEEDFAALPAASAAPLNSGAPVQLLHSGLVYPEERDPRPFFRALARLKRDGKISRETVQVNFRACGFEPFYAKQIAELGIEEVVCLLPRIPYMQALREYVASDALLLMQAKNCDHQIPAKAYEYFRLGKPILGLTTENGDTGMLLRQVGGSTIIDLADEDAIYRGLPAFLAAVKERRHATPSADIARSFSRRSLTQQLVVHLDQLEAARGIKLVQGQSHEAS
jgi:glycosyltransferase involved in cell wall biosynthesis